jgi:hypothetical protein
MVWLHVMKKILSAHLYQPIDRHPLIPLIHLNHSSPAQFFSLKCMGVRASLDSQLVPQQTLKLRICVLIPL